MENYLLFSNRVLLKGLCILWMTNSHDISFVPRSNKIEIRLKNHSYGISKIIGEISHEIFKKMILNIKIACNLSILNENTIDSCSFEFFLDKFKYFIRASFHPSYWGQSLTLRILNSNIFKNIFSVERHFTRGLNIIGGKTASGKTSLLYASLSKINGNILTLEDPVEYFLDNAIQTDVSSFGYDFYIASALRQNPDIICIGEIRDEKSASCAIKASLSGHITVATIHIDSPLSLFSRFNEMNINFYSEVLNSLIYMRNFIPEIYKYQNNTLNVYSN
jgi:type II secretory ATPase GspE/PulE/Tfp pilus assembly ATPase PilB-like protein